MSQTQTIDVQAEIAQRREKAAEGLQRGEYAIAYLGEPEADIHAWQVENAGSGYQVNYRRSAKTWECDCPDFHRFGSILGTCKHCEMVRLNHERTRAARTTERSASGNRTEGSGAPVPAGPQPAVPPTPPPPAAEGPVAPHQPPPVDQSNETTTAAADVTIKWGKHRGVRLGDLVQTDEGAGYLMWVIRKMEPKSEADTALKAAARSVVEARVNAEAETILAGQGTMPEVPFGDEKGKSLDKCHPKWVTILARKSLDDAFTFKDAVTYAVAARLKTRLDEKRGGSWGRGGSIDSQAAERLAAAIEHLATAIEKVAKGRGLQRAIRDGMLDVQTYLNGG